MAAIYGSTSGEAPARGTRRLRKVAPLALLAAVGSLALWRGRAQPPAAAQPGATPALATITGRVIDRSLRPLAGATVRAERAGAEAQIVVSDNDGAFRLTLVGGHHAFTAAAPGFAPQTQHLEVAGQWALSFQLYPAAQITGLVLARGAGDVSGRALAEAEVRLLPADPKGDAREVRADGAGNFAFTDLSPGRYVLLARQGDRAGFHSEPIAVALGERRFNLHVELDRAARISGRVIGPGGTALADAVVEMEPADRAGPNLAFAAPFTTTTDREGRYALRGIPPGRYHVRATAENTGAAPVRELTVAAADLGDVDLKLLPASRLSGQVLDPEGQPVSDAIVEATIKSGPRRARPALASTRSRGDGRYAFSDLASGVFTLVVRHPEFGELVLQPGALPPGTAQTLPLKFARPAYVRGEVRWHDGAPADGARVRWFPSDRGDASASATVARDGSYRLGPLQPGTGRCQAELPTGPLLANAPTSPGRTRQQRAGVEARAGEEIRDVELTLLRDDQVITGIVRDERGAPVVNALVAARPSFDGGAAAGEPDRPPVPTDADGRFVLGGLPAGAYELHAEHVRYAPAKRTDVIAGTENVSLTFAPPAYVSGRVEPGGLIRVELVEALGAGENGSRITRPRTAWIFDARKGAFRVGPLAAGDYHLVAATPRGERGLVSGLKLRAGEHRENVRVRLLPQAPEADDTQARAVLPAPGTPAALSAIAARQAHRAAQTR